MSASSSSMLAICWFSSASAFVFSDRLSPQPFRCVSNSIVHCSACERSAFSWEIICHSEKRKSATFSCCVCFS